MSHGGGTIPVGVSRRVFEDHRRRRTPTAAVGQGSGTPLAAVVGTGVGMNQVRPLSSGNSDEGTYSNPR